MDAVKTNALPDKLDVEEAVRCALALAHAGALAARGLEEICDGDSETIESLFKAVTDQASIIKTWFYEVYEAPQGGA